MKRLDTIVNAFDADIFPATSVTYACSLLCTWVGADLWLLIQVHDGASPMEWARRSFVHRMLKIPAKSPHARGVG